jgi:hypothetical protein
MVKPPHVLCASASVLAQAPSPLLNHAMQAARPTVTVYGPDGAQTGSVPIPAVLLAPIRNDVVQFVHSSACPDDALRLALQYDC